MRGGRRAVFPILSQTVEMEREGLADQFPHLGPALRDGDAAWQVRYICTITSLALLDNDGVAHRFSPACLRMLLSVPGGTSRLGSPATVTVPDFVGCSNCR